MPPSTETINASSALNFAGWALLVAAFFGALAAFLTIFYLVRSRGIFASKDDLKRAETAIRDSEQRVMTSVTNQLAEMANQQRAVFSRLGQIETTVRNFSGEMERALGRLEGAVEALKEEK